jgi:hypothetical protein
MTRDRNMPRLRDSGEILGQDFLSIDIEALITKIAGRSFRSPHHYPVELVRSALARGARSVDVTIGRSRVEVRDDGPPLAADVLENLERVFDSRIDAPERQEALAGFESEQGIGILAAFAPSPREVCVETGAGKESGTRLVFRSGAGPRREKSGALSGTVVRVLRTGSDPGREAQTLVDYCKYAGARIMLNGSLISRHHAGGQAMASTDLRNLEGADGATLWIPVIGDLCRVWMLDHGVRWNQAVFAPPSGFVYEASVECPGRLPEGFSGRAREAAAGLYRTMAGQVEDMPPDRKERAQELLFLHYVQTREIVFLGDVKLFPVLGAGPCLSLKEIGALSSEGLVYALRADDDPGRYDTRSPTVLVLTPAQWEFLVEHAHVPLSKPVPTPSADPWPARLGRRLRAAADAAVSRFRLGLLRPVEKRDLSEGETLLLDMISKELESGRFRMPGLDRGESVKVLVSNTGGKAPGRLISHRGERVLALFRRSPVLRKASRAVKKDPANIAMVLSLLADGREGLLAGGV